MPYRPIISLTAMLLLLLSCRDESVTSSAEWPVYSADPAGSKYSPLDQINTENVSQLEPAWIYRTGDKREKPNSTIECNPIIVNGTMYLTSPGLKVIALDAATGQEIWRFDPFQGRRASGVNRA
jgi:quinoprotein glucose dehydrogenase